MFSYLDKLRQKPVAARRRFALVLTLVIVGIIATLWAVWFLVKLGTSFSEERGARLNAEDSGIESPYKGR